MISSIVLFFTRRDVPTGINPAAVLLFCADKKEAKKLVLLQASSRTDLCFSLVSIRADCKRTKKGYGL